MTNHWKVPPAVGPEDPGILEAARLIRAGGLVAFPTETVYGLGADARSTAAVEGIFEAKGRPSDNPLIVHIAQREQVDELTEGADELSRRLMDAFWPGPLTLVLPVKPGAVSPRVTAGLATVGVRMPDHPAALALIAAAGCPVAAPSANRSGRPSPTTAEHVLADLAGRIAGVVDAGPTGVGVESTVVEVAGGDVHVLRPGGVTAAQLRTVVPRVSAPHEDAADGGSPAAAAEEPDHAPKAPGMKYTHYAPQGRLTLVDGDPERTAAWIREELRRAKAAGERTGVLAFDEHLALYDADVVLSCGSRERPEEAARRLYAALRTFDEEGATFLLAEAPDSQGLGSAVLNRLIKAAGHRLVQV
ncbi:threonylcarbamoyl-AMP synthase [Paenibacillus sp. J31TS4]|nr:L-threonylcarbamoyladenylate synthase [Paenibacillus sp. J31TS4]GIP40926.1 threonylcarbamoyl-AMP synthase [Paenibacillus sp. J31TS4]